MEAEILVGSEPIKDDIDTFDGSADTLESDLVINSTRTLQEQKAHHTHADVPPMLETSDNVSVVVLTGIYNMISPQASAITGRSTYTGPAIEPPQTSKPNISHGNEPSQVGARIFELQCSESHTFLNLAASRPVFYSTRAISSRGGNSADINPLESLAVKDQYEAVSTSPGEMSRISKSTEPPPKDLPSPVSAAAGRPLPSPITRTARGHRRQSAVIDVGDFGGNSVGTVPLLRPHIQARTRLTERKAAIAHQSALQVRAEELRDSNGNTGSGNAVDQAILIATVKFKSSRSRESGNHMAVACTGRSELGTPKLARRKQVMWNDPLTKTFSGNTQVEGSDGHVALSDLNRDPESGERGCTKDQSESASL